MPEPGTLTDTSTATAATSPWNVVVHNDPVNLAGYVTRVLMNIFGYPRERATKLMLEVHHGGRAIVWSGAREKAEFYVQQLHAHQLKATIEKAS